MMMNLALRRFIIVTAIFLDLTVRPCAASQITSVGWKVVGQIGGATQGIAVQGNYAYVGVGLRLVVLDISNSATLRQIGASKPFPHFVEHIAVKGTLVYVAAGNSGLRVVDISNPSQPQEIGAWDSPGFAEGVAISGNTVYLADGPYGLRVLNASNPAQPTEIGSVYPMNYAFKVAVSGNYAYVAAAGAGLLVADVSDPAHPVEVGAYDTPGYAYGVAASGDTVYLADGWEGLKIFDAGVKNNPRLAGQFKTPGQSFNVAISGNLAYVADGLKGLRVLDVSTPSLPVELGSYETDGGHAGGVAVVGATAYVADRNWGLRVLNVSDPAHPAQAGFYGPLGYADGVAVSGGRAYVAAATYGLRVVDVSTPSNPVELGAYDTGFYATSAAVKGNYAYVATTHPANVHVVDVTDPTHPIQAGCYVPTTVGVNRDMALIGGIVYLADEAGLELVDVSDPHSPAYLGLIRLDQEGDAVVGVAASGALAYMACSFAGIKIVNVSDPSNPKLIGAYNSGSSFTQDLVVSGGRAYLADYFGLRVVNVSDPANPRGEGFLKTPGEAYGVAISGSTAYVAGGGGGTSIVDVSDPYHPLSTWRHRSPGYAHEVVAANGRLYVADGPNGLLILEPVSGAADSEASPATDDTMFSQELKPRHQPADDLPAGPAGGYPFAHAPLPASIMSGVRERRSVPPPASPPGESTAAQSTCLVTSAADSGQGTLRWCLETVTSGATILFDTSLFSPSNPATIMPASRLPELSQGAITIDGSNAGVILDGRNLSGLVSGLTVTSDGNVIRGLQILHFPDSGLTVFGGNNIIGGNRAIGKGSLGQGNLLSGNRGFVGLNIGGTGNAVVGNLVGTDISGTSAIGNAMGGIFIGGGSNNQIGGLDLQDRNIVSGNRGNGISVMVQGHGNSILGNYVGTDISGSKDLGNTGHGISMELAGFDNLIQGNVSSGNSRAGVCVSDWGSNYNVIVGNLLGTDAGGTKAIANDWCGIFSGFMGSSFNRIGGTEPDERNLISGNSSGVGISGPGSSGTLILGNLIGTDITGMLPLGNASVGIGLGGGSRAMVGGTTAPERNVVSDNDGPAGIDIDSESNYVAGNYIGTKINGGGALGNRWIGLRVQLGEHNVIQNNRIAHTRPHETGSGGEGIEVDSYPYNAIRRNSLHKNAGRGIFLNEGNAMLPAPLIKSVANSKVYGTACPGCTVEIFSAADNEGRIYEGSATADDAGGFAFRKAGFLTGPKITSTATDKDGNTSEFSTPRKLALALKKPADEARFSACSLYRLPVFSWSVRIPFESFTIQFSSSPGFASIPIQIQLPGTNLKTVINSYTWGQLLALPGAGGGIVYWRMIGTRVNGTKAKSAVRSFIIEPPFAVGDAAIAPTTLGGLPTLSWRNNCNTIFSVVFADTADFAKPGVRKTSLSFRQRFPMRNNGVFLKILDNSQWQAIKELVDSIKGSTIYWRVKGRDGLNRRSQTTVMNFTLMD